jgi:hypothetical protein
MKLRRYWVEFYKIEIDQKGNKKEKVLGGVGFLHPIDSTVTVSSKAFMVCPLSYMDANKIEIFW